MNIRSLIKSGQNKFKEGAYIGGFFLCRQKTSYFFQVFFIYDLKKTVASEKKTTYISMLYVLLIFAN